MQDEKRLFEFDLLRIFSIFCIIILHTAASNFFIDVNATSFGVFNVYDSLVRFSVPVFFMLSGMLFLNPRKELSFQKLFSKNILRLITAFVFWSGAYAFIDVVFEFKSLNVIEFIKRFIIGWPHMWFIFTLIGLYLAVPLLRKITESKKLTEYFLLLSFVFGIILPALKLIPFLNPFLEDFFAKSNLNFFMGYTFYFLLGHYLYSNVFTKKFKIIVYTLGGVSLIFTILATWYFSVQKGTATTIFYEYLMPNTCFVAVAVFIFFKDVVGEWKFSEKQKKIILTFSNCSFGIYLVHIFFNMLYFDTLKINTLSFNTVFSVPILSLLVYFSSFILVFIISKIPFFKKWII